MFKLKTNPVHTLLLLAFIISTTSCNKKTTSTTPASGGQGSGYSKPQVETGTVSCLTYNLACCKATIKTNGSQSVTARGFCWDTVPHPNFYSQRLIAGSDTGSFDFTFYPLNSNKKYYARAFATTSRDTVYSEELSFKTPAPWQVVNNTLKPRYEVFYGYNNALFGIYMDLSDSLVDVSFNGGVTWQSIRNNLRGNTNCMLGKDNYLFAGGDGVWRSADNGGSWTKLNGLPGGINVSCLSAFGGVIYAGTFSGKGIYYSNNNGTNWHSAGLALSSTDHVYSVFMHKNTLFAGTSSGIYASPDYGTNWTKKSPLTGSTPFYAYFFASIGDRIYTASNYNYSQLYYSDNLGAAWYTASSCFYPYNVNSLIGYNGSLYISSYLTGVSTTYNNGFATGCSNLNLGLNPPQYSSGKLVLLGSQLYMLDNALSGPVVLYRMDLSQ